MCGGPCVLMEICPRGRKGQDPYELPPLRCASDWGGWITAILVAEMPQIFLVNDSILNKNRLLTHIEIIKYNSENFRDFSEVLRRNHGVCGQSTKKLHTRQSR